MAKSTDFKKEIQALRNQAKARGHNADIPEEELKEKAFVYNQSVKPNYGYVYKDLFKTLLFVVFALAFLFAASVKLSSLPQFAHFRQTMHISQFSF